MTNLGAATVDPTRPNGNAAAFVRVTAIRKAFGLVPALQGIGFDVPLGSHRVTARPQRLRQDYDAAIDRRA